MAALSPLSLRGLRASVQPEYAGMEAQDLEQLIDEAVAELPSDTAENVMNALSSLGKTVAPTLQRAAPSIAQGAATGATVGGPWGALIGAGAGFASSMGKKPGATKQGAPAAPPAASQSAAGQAAVPALPSGQGAAATLLGLMQNPIVQNAILSQVLGSAGALEIAAPGGAQIPRGAINNLLMQLLASASESIGESETEGEDAYLKDAEGEYLADPASPEQQAAVVLHHLREAAPSLMTDEESAEWGEDEALMMVDDVESPDAALESVEFY